MLNNNYHDNDYDDPIYEGLVEKGNELIRRSETMKLDQLMIMFAEELYMDNVLDVLEKYRENNFFNILSIVFENPERKSIDDIKLTYKQIRKYQRKYKQNLRHMVINMWIMNNEASQPCGLELYETRVQENAYDICSIFLENIVFITKMKLYTSL